MTVEATARLRVLASGSGGNCSLLALGQGHRTRLCLIDAGLSPRRTRRLLADDGLRLDHIDDILLTHLDRDHFHQGWTAAALPIRVRFRMHADHAPKARKLGVPPGAITEFDRPFCLRGETTVTPVTLSHDSLGVSAFRFDWPTDDAGHAPSLGFATDLGRATQQLIDTFQGVGTLAIESNYCPKMQLASGRPDFLKARIMNGSGHLSNEQARDAVREINPGHHVVFLHLSRQCNRPELVESMHAGSTYGFTPAHQFNPTPWIPIRAAPTTPHPKAPATPPASETLFDLAGPA